MIRKSLFSSFKMTNSTCQVIGFLVSLISGLGVIVAIAMPYWSRDTNYNDVIEAQQYAYGLWWKCIFISTGHWTCDAYDNFFLGTNNKLLSA